MAKKIFGAIFFLVLLFTLSTPTFAQEAEKKETKKMAMKEKGKTEMKAMGAVKEVACDDACGFKVRSRNEKELIAVVKQHAKTYHKVDLTDAQVKEKMKEVK